MGRRDVSCERKNIKTCYNFTWLETRAEDIANFLRAETGPLGRKEDSDPAERSS
jgi:hypothetical protein